MSEEGKQERSVSDELNKLGQHFSEVIRTTWESEDRKRIQGEIIEGLTALRRRGHRGLEQGRRERHR